MNYPLVTWTCTSGRRLDMFQKMMKSFRNTCKDTDLIAEYLCADDRSSELDMNWMKKTYSNIKFLENTKHGQLNSLNLLMQHVKTEWIFHTEDDWEFLTEGNYIRTMFDIAHTDERIKNVIMRNWCGIYVKDGDVEYRMHNYAPQDKYKYSAISDCDWYGLSFNPSIIHVPTLKLCLSKSAQLTPSVRGWDKVVARTYWSMGLKRANLCGEWINHIGKMFTHYQHNIDKDTKL